VNVWLVVLIVGAATVCLKAAGPVLLGRRRLPDPIAGVVALLGPVLLAALVVTQTVGGDNELVLDARLAGVVAAATTAIVRLLA
jgi:branched chain amino acid efflux pump